MKVAIITDTHFGVRNDSQYLINHFNKFLDNVFYPYLENNNITEVLHLGDLVDRRKFINFNTAKHVTRFLDRLYSMEKRVVIVCGNHDVFYKNTNELNALDLLCGVYENVTVLIEPQELLVGSLEVLFIPWINPENQEKSLELIKNTRAQVCMGHLEIQGFEMHRGSFCEHGSPKELFDKFDVVLSGHFHHKSSYQNIHYLGSPYQMTWADYNDPKGFHVFDTETRELEFISNPYKLFQHLSYDDAGKTMEQVLEYDPVPYSESYVKVIVKSKDNPYWFDLFMEKLEKVGPIDVKVVDDHLNLNLETDDEILDQAADTLTILNQYINQTQIPQERKIRLDMLLRELYIQASTIQS